MRRGSLILVHSDIHRQHDGSRISATTVTSSSRYPSAARNAGAIQTSVPQAVSASISPISSAPIRSMQRTVAPAGVAGQGASHQGFMMDITVEADCAGQLRHLLTGTCGDMVSFMQTQTMDHARKIKLRFCVSAPAWNLIMSAIMQALPSAEFGRITRH